MLPRLRVPGRAGTDREGREVMRATPERVLRRVRGLIGTSGNEVSTAMVARLVLRRVLFDGEAVPAWRRHAACAGMPAEGFYPGPGDHEAIAAARRVCRGCPVRSECLADALAWEACGRRHGIVGGLSARQREQLVAGRRQEQAAGGGAVA